MASLSSRKTIHLYLDDSNLWITSMKVLAEHHKLPQGCQEKRGRVDLISLVRVVRRCVVLSRDWDPYDVKIEASLYGSKPPPNDSVWKAATRQKFRVKIFEKSARGTEKEVDAALNSDASMKAGALGVEAKYGKTDLSQHAFAIISGDRDMRPLVKNLTLAGIDAHVFSFNQSLSGVYRQLGDRVFVHETDGRLHGRVPVHQLQFHTLTSQHQQGDFLRPVHQL